jgi:hypothetical protein
MGGMGGYGGGYSDSYGGLNGYGNGYGMYGNGLGHSMQGMAGNGYGYGSRAAGRPPAQANRGRAGRSPGEKLEDAWVGGEGDVQSAAAPAALDRQFAGSGEDSAARNAGAKSGT